MTAVAEAAHGVDEKKNIVLLHENEWPYTSRTTQIIFWSSGGLFYSPKLTLSDY